MKVKTNPEHQSFEADKVVLDKPTIRLLQTIGSLILAIGIIKGGGALIKDRLDNIATSRLCEENYAKIMQMYENGKLEKWKD